MISIAICHRRRRRPGASRPTCRKVPTGITLLSFCCGAAMCRQHARLTHHSIPRCATRARRSLSSHQTTVTRRSSPTYGWRRSKVPTRHWAWRWGMSSSRSSTRTAQCPISTNMYESLPTCHSSSNWRIRATDTMPPACSCVQLTSRMTLA